MGILRKVCHMRTPAALLRFTALALVLAVGLCLAQEDFRTWTSAKGTMIEAQLVRQTGNAVFLRTRAGQSMQIDKQSLSVADRTYLSRLTSGSVVSAAASGGDWPQWRGANRDGKSSDTGLLKSWPADGPSQIWKGDGIGEGYSSVAVVDRNIYVTGGVGDNLVLFAYRDDGRLQWQAEVGAVWRKSYAGSRATPAVSDGRVYVLSGNGTIGCHSTDTGRKLWAREMSEFDGRPSGWGFSESILVTDELAIVTPGREKCMVALDKKTGRTRWESPGNRGDPHYCSPIAISHGGNDMIINGTRNGLFAVRPSDGRVLWSSDFSAGNTANCCTPAFSDGYVFWANGYGKGGVCLHLSGTDAREVWTTRDMVAHHGGYVIHDGHVYGNNGGGWACIELQSGKTVWNGRGVGKGSLCFADGMLYLFSEDGGQVGLAPASPDGLELKGSFSVAGEGKSWAHPVVARGRLYLRYGDNLYCYDVQNP